MRNLSKTLRVITPDVARERPKICEALRTGWLDAKFGRGFCAAYETAGAAWQRNYEMARQAVAWARAEGRELPKWPPGKRFPRSIVLVMARAQAAGAILPTRKLDA